MEKIKSQKGISLTILIITIFILLLLATVSIKAYTDYTDYTKLNKFNLELETIRLSVVEIANTNQDYTSLGTAITEEQRNLLESIINDNSNLAGIQATNFKYFTSEDLEKQLQISAIEQNVFISFIDLKVISADGLSVKGKTYYLPTEEIYNVEYLEEGINENLTYELEYDEILKSFNVTLKYEDNYYSIRYRKEGEEYWKSLPSLSFTGRPMEKYEVLVSKLDGKTFIKVIILKDHVAGAEWVTLAEPTCTLEGKRAPVCIRCGYPIEELAEIIPSLGHNMGEWEQIKAATCLENGIQTRVCARCGYTETKNEPAALGHEWGEWETIEEIIEVDGETVEKITKQRKCNRCGIIDTDTMKSVNVGDYVNYTFDTADVYSTSSTYAGVSDTIYQDTTITWRVMGTDENGNIKLISDAATYNTSSSGKAMLELDGPLGYNNGVFLLNDICAKHYSNSELGITARSINIEDLEQEYTEETFNRIANRFPSYGDTSRIMNCGNKYYPEIYKYEIGSGVDISEIRLNGLGRSETPSEFSNGLTANKWIKTESSLLVYKTLYTISYTEDIFKSTKFYQIIFHPEDSITSVEDSWIASRFSNNYSGDTWAVFGIYQIGGLTIPELDYQILCTTSNKSDYTWDGVDYLRPVVTIPSYIAIGKPGEDGTKTNMFSLIDTR